MQTFKPVIRWWTIVSMRILAHFSETLEVREDRLVYIKGIFNKSEVVIPFSRIANYSAEQNVFDRIFGLGNFKVETTGSNITPELNLVGYSYKLRDVLAQAMDQGKS